MPHMPASTTHRLSVAPMMDWTDRHCRYFHRQLAPHARLYTEMVHAQAVLHGDRERLLGHDAMEHPLALQLGGSEPTALAEATRIAATLDFDEVNLNVGCPSDRVQAGRFGACLMREPSLVADCIAAMRDAVANTRVAVTVKCRLGVDEVEDYDTFRAFVDAIAATGCTGFALAHLEHVDGVMLGRVAYHDPYVLHRLDNALAGEDDVPRADLLLRMQPYVEAQLSRGIALKHVVRHVLGLFHGQPGGRAFRQVLSEGAHKPGADWSLVERALAVTRHPSRHAA
jgi:tRNA-dihydrouridine synthase A